LRRIDAPVIWDMGYHPQVKMSFGSPLPTGMASASEWADVELKRPTDVAAFGAALGEALPEGLPLLAFREVSMNEKPVAARTLGYVYRVMAPDGQRREAADRLAAWLAADTWPVELVKKKKTHTVDLKAAPLRLVPHADGGWELHVASSGVGARVRDVLRAVFGDDAAAGTRGWSTIRTETLFVGQHDPLDPQRGAQPSP
jgi:radical SAM-linked protein